MSNGKREAPIIVCGVARSGTTFVRDLIDSHPDIAMSDEFFLYRISSLSTLLKELEAVAGKRCNWSSARSKLVRAMWFCATDEKRQEKGVSARRFGNKTPGAEHYFDFYEEVFADAPPKYVYVMREGERVFLSRLNMRWGRTPTIGQQVKRYLLSIAKFEAFLSRSPDRIHLLRIDQIGEAYEDRVEEVERLFAFIGENVTAHVQQFVERWRHAQTTSGKHKNHPENVLHALPDKAVKFLASHGAYQACMAKYGYDTVRDHSRDPFVGRRGNRIQVPRLLRLPWGSRRRTTGE